MTIILDGTNGITSPGETLTSTQTLAAGTTSNAPLVFQSGVNLTTPLAGAMNYDGKVFYATPQGTQRGVTPSAQFFRLDAGLAGANVNTVQNALGVGVTLSASTAYEFEAAFMFIKTAGVTSHSFSLSFGGTATINSVMYAGTRVSGNTSSGTLTNATNLMFGSNSVAALAVDTTITSAAVMEVITFRGTVSVNAGGTFIPQYTLSAAPGGAYTTQAGSYMLIYPIGASGANTSVGAWA